MTPLSRTLLPSGAGGDPAILGPSPLTHGELALRVLGVSASLSEIPPGLVVHPFTNDVAGIVLYLAALETGRPIALVDPDASESVLSQLAELYRPALVTGASELDGYATGPFGAVRIGPPAPVHPDLAVLLPTSGSTGSPKLVRLSFEAVVSNARSIAAALGIDRNERAPLSLPLHYSYGLSILNSHVAAGASVLPTRHSMLEREFWSEFDAEGCTSIAGVPYTYQMLRRLRFDPRDHPSLRAMTQAGGKLADDLVAEFHARARAAGVKFYVMYGQTEATARMSVLPPDDLPHRLGSVGTAIPGGRFETVDGEVVYEGPNVMMGYAESADDLTLEDQLGGRLHTGDLGWVDDEGYLTLTGRSKRIGKVFGTRVSLDDVEALVAVHGPNAAVAEEDRVVVYIEASGQLDARTLVRSIASQLRLPVRGFDVVPIEVLPRRSNGKTDYQALEEIHAAR